MYVGSRLVPLSCRRNSLLINPARSVCLSVCLSPCLPACLPVCLSVCRRHWRHYSSSFLYENNITFAEVINIHLLMHSVWHFGIGLARLSWQRVKRDVQCWSSALCASQSSRKHCTKGVSTLRRLDSTCRNTLMSMPWLHRQKLVQNVDWPASVAVGCVTLSYTATTVV